MIAEERFMCPSSAFAVQWRFRAALVVGFLAVLTFVGRAQVVRGTGTFVTAARVFVVPDADRIPIATLPAGTVVEVLSKEGDWYQVVFHDPPLGDRTGYTLASNLRVVPTRPPPPLPAPAASGRASSPPKTARPGTAPDVRSTGSERRFPGGLFSVNATRQGTSTAFTGKTTFSQNAETGSITTSYASSHPIVVDVAGTQRLWHVLAIAVAGTWASQTGDGAVSADIPHPFKFSAPRVVNGVTSGLPRRELALHLDPALLIPMGRAADLAIFGGPSYFRVTQGLVTSVTSTDVYPYDTATFVGATAEASTRSHPGFNAGFDVTVGFSKHVGVGALARYSRASLGFTSSDGGDIEIKAGGLQVGGGVRFRF
jgi:hypothetical protein